MPLYLYKCNICNHTVEEFRKVDEREIKKPCGQPLKEQTGFRNEKTCPGSLIFQPMQKTNFTMHRLND